MMFAEIQPADVYLEVLKLRADVQSMRFTHWVIGLLVSVQLAATFVIFTRVIAVLRRSIANEKRAERLLTLAEKHGHTTDKKVDQMEDSAHQIAKAAPALQAATAEVITEVKAVPHLVVKAIEEEKKKGDSQHGF